MILLGVHLRLLCVICGPCIGLPGPDFTGVDQAVEAALARGDCPGAVVGVVRKDAVVYRKAFGHRAVQPEKVPMTVDAVFDLASLTKPMATGTSVMRLVEQGKLKLDDPASKHWPAFGAAGKDAVTVRQLLLHTSGLIDDNPLADYADGRAKALDRIAALRLEAPAGSRFRYSDVGYIVLGELVERIGGKPVDEYAKEYVFGPLGMADTGYRPDPKRVAPTGKREGKIILGAVHDPRAFRLGGVAGHAGLFGTADDLARYARMLLRGGELDGVRVLKPETVRLFTEGHEVPEAKPSDPPKKLLRSFGWDVDTAYTAQRGEVFRGADGFGHTGFTGTSVWIDRPSQTAVILLTNRVHPDDKGNVVRLRREVGTAVAKAVGAK
ncbi:MAG: beta-lactamase family protein [Gemmataceae bacterium]|nr:beta-lactamase family protein [Gemmataceae bacterium]